MAISAEQLNIILTAKDKAFATAMEKNARRIQSFEAKSKKSLGGAGASFEALGKMAAKAAPFVAGFFSVQMLQNAAHMATELKNLSTLTGVNVERFQEMAYASSRYGVSQEKMADIIKDTNDKLGDFLQNGGGPMKDFFDNIAPKVGITADAFRKLNGADALQLYVTSLQKAGVSQSEMTFYMEALASDSALLTPLLMDNGTEMNNLAESARSLGIVLDEDLIAQTAQMDQVWSAVMSSMSRNFTAFAMNVINGFDNIFGITTIGQMNIAKRQLGDLATEAADLQAQLNEADINGGMISNLEMGGALGTGVVNPEAAKKRLKEIADQEAAANAELARLKEMTDRVNAAREKLANTESFGTGETPASKGAGTKKDPVKEASDAFATLMGNLDGARKAENDFATAQKIVNDALKAGVITSDEAQLAIGILTTQMQLAKKEMVDMSGVANILDDGMTNAFMSILEGTQSTKDAFKSMASDIIKELYRVLVVQRMVGSLGSATSGGSGILGFIGGLTGLRTNASGGALQAGQPSVVGEQGREIFVPSTSGRVLSVGQAQSAAGLGGGGNITVVQHNSFGAGVSRAEINSMMPKIVETTKAAVLDAKKRGGSYGSAFA